MKKKTYQKPRMEVHYLMKPAKLLAGSGVAATRDAYGSGMTDDPTEWTIWE